MRGLPLLRAYVCGVAPGVEAGVDAAEEVAMFTGRKGTASAAQTAASVAGIDDTAAAFPVRP